MNELEIARMACDFCKLLLDDPPTTNHEKLLMKEVLSIIQRTINRCDMDTVEIKRP